MDPLIASAVVGGIQSVLGAAGAQAQQAQAEQNYKDALKYQRVSDRFARWNAKINARVSNTAAKYKYFTDLVAYNQDKAYVGQLRNYEVVKAINQAKVVRETRTSAMTDYVMQAQALSETVREQAASDAVSYYQFMQQGVRARSAVMANETEGVSADRIYRDYDRQLGDMHALQQINQKFRDRQYSREQAGQIAQYISRYNSQQFYTQQPYQDPIKPFAPLPTLVMPQPPSMTGAGPSQAAANLNTASAILGGLNSAVGTYSMLSKYTG